MTSLPYDFVASDMDGTLLTPDHMLSEFTMRTLYKIAKKNVPLILATGRNHIDVRKVNEQLLNFFRAQREKERRARRGSEHGSGDGGSSTADTKAVGAATNKSDAPLATYLITSNGSVVHNATTRQLIHASFLDPAMAEKLYRFIAADDATVNTHMYQYDRWFARYDWPAILAYHKMSGLTYTVCHNPPPLVPMTASEAAANAACSGADAVRQRTVCDGCFEGVMKVFFDVRDSADLPGLTARLRNAFAGCPVAFTSSGSHFIEAIAQGVNKGVALKAVLRLLKGDKTDIAQCLRRTIAFGDELNDVEMLQSVGKGCLMGNGNVKVKEVCPQLECIESNAANGMARKLCEVFGLDARQIEAECTSQPKL